MTACSQQAVWLDGWERHRKGNQAPNAKPLAANGRLPVGILRLWGVLYAMGKWMRASETKDPLKGNEAVLGAKVDDDTIREMFLRADEDEQIQAQLDEYIRMETLRMRLDWYGKFNVPSHPTKIPALTKGAQDDLRKRKAQTSSTCSRPDA